MEIDPCSVDKAIHQKSTNFKDNHWKTENIVLNSICRLVIRINVIFVTNEHLRVHVKNSS